MGLELLFQRLVEPGSGHPPLAFDGGERDAEHFGDFRVGEAAEEAHLDDAAFLFVFLGQAFQGFVQSHQVGRALATHM